MSPDTAAAVVSGMVGLIIAALAIIKGKDKSGIASATANLQSPQAMVSALATGSTETVVINVGVALVALARTIADQTSRLEALERREAQYVSRINELEAWGTWAADPPPRKVPPWIDRPQ